MASFPRIPINPRLIFGESIENVCTRGRLHPGLKELFTKAYFSAHPNECLVEDDGASEENFKTSPGAWILTILKFAQGDVSVRLSLKRRLETGRWLMPLQVPPAAPLWLIRHFLGRLRTPLIFCHKTGTCELEAFKKRWILLSKDCHEAMLYHTFKQDIHLSIQTKIAQVMEEMQLEACLTLISLITLIRNLSYEPTHDWIDKHAVKALIDYFVPALISRPYRPGYLTKEDKVCRPTLCYLCHNLPEIQDLSKRPETRNKVHLIFDSSLGTSILELYKKQGTFPEAKKVISEDFKAHLSKTLHSKNFNGEGRTPLAVKKVISEDLKSPPMKTDGLHCEKSHANGVTPSVVKKVISDVKSPPLKTDALYCENSRANGGTLTVVKKLISMDFKTQISETGGLNSKALFRNIETIPTVKNLISEDLKTLISGADAPDSENLQLPPFLMSGNHCTTKTTRMDCIQDLQKEQKALSSPTSLETKDEGESKDPETDGKPFNRNSEKEVVTNQKSFLTNEESHIAIPLKDEEQEKNAVGNVIEYTSENEKNITECGPEKQCHAIKLAYKLRGQWLAWRLAGIFLDGATSNISGFGYTKLPHDASSTINH